ncbi:MAG: hypothetical protein Q8916_09375 [Bacteroidota bacterium]|nr:hypothetical protein [Bacteroidota bacterium]MDP4230598.1 hypothetical protein [Bacteroidota bacterium]MDP4235689.1 hypothetical protein [Bacteroidota bacterium]
MKTTPYFENSVRSRRSYLKTEWIEYVIANPESMDVQSDGRIRHWAYIEELGKYLRVITLDDGETVLNAFPDRDYQRTEL